MKRKRSVSEDTAEDDVNVLVNNALMSSNKIKDIFVDQNLVKQLINHNKHFTHTIKDYPDISDQEHSGRCWMFASMYPFRVAMIREYGLDDSFEFSTSWLYYHHKMERFRTAILSAVNNRNIRLSTKDDQLSNYILSIGDGGLSDSFYNLVEKYGLVPKDVYGESAHTKSTSQLNDLLRMCLKTWLFRLRDPVEDTEKLSKLGEQAIAEASRILNYCLGVPPASFDWSYNRESREKVIKKWQIIKEEKEAGDKLQPPTKKFKRKHYVIEKFTPLEYWNLVCNAYGFKPTSHDLVCDPHRLKNKVYAGVKGLTNVYEQQQRRRYLNLDVDTILEYMKRVIQEGLPAVLSLDIDQDSYYTKKIGVLSPDLYHYDQLISDFSSLQSKELVEAGLENINHVVCVTGYNEDRETWKIANSWGTDHGYGGHLIATSSWFHKHVFSVNIPTEILSDDHKELLNSEPSGTYHFTDLVW